MAAGYAGTRGTAIVAARVRLDLKAHFMTGYGGNAALASGFFEQEMSIVIMQERRSSVSSPPERGRG
jgi:hypothetical protein